MKYEGMIMWLERHKDELLMGSAIICPNCGETIYHSDMMCRRCTQVIDWGDNNDE